MTETRNRTNGASGEPVTAVGPSSSARSRKASRASAAEPAQNRGGHPVGDRKSGLNERDPSEREHHRERQRHERGAGEQSQVLTDDRLACSEQQEDGRQRDGEFDHRRVAAFVPAAVECRPRRPVDAGADRRDDPRRSVGGPAHDSTHDRVRRGAGSRCGGVADRVRRRLARADQRWGGTTVLRWLLRLVMAVSGDQVQWVRDDRLRERRGRRKERHDGRECECSCATAHAVSSR